jgi:cytochrome oxidase Cu insertion factor (SCO1/SenC/PrrC family)
MKLRTFTIASMVFPLLLTCAAIGHAEGDGEMIPIGEPFVDFELKAHDGTTVSSSDLEGHPFLLFFYPKASTPG